MTSRNGLSLSQEPVETQRAVVAIPAILKIIAKSEYGA